MSEIHSNNRRVFAALLFIGLGLLFLLGNIGIFYVGDVFADYWPVIFLFIGISRFISTNHDVGGGLFFVGLGLIFLAANLDFLGGSIADYWPLFLVLVGVWILFRPRYQKEKFPFREHWNEGISENKVEEKEGWLNIVTIFGGQERPVQSDNFKGGEVTIIFGGSKLDLRQIHTTEKELHLEITAVFSGLDIIVPPQWPLDINITPMFGSVEDKRRIMLQDVVGDQPRLYLHGSSIFSGIEISS